MESVRLLIVTGPVGVGKSKVSETVSDKLTAKKIPNAFIDFDHLACAYPPPTGDRFNSILAFKNLSVIWPNYCEMGIQHVIIPNVIENREEIEQFNKAVPKAEITVVRLTAEISTLHKRLENRETGDMLAWHRKRAIELTEIFALQKVEDFIIDTEDKSISIVADEVLSKWLGRN